MNDDWSYIWSARVLAQTGHVVYNGWATAMLTWQLYWGALFVRLFGFSFLTLRMSVLVLSMATVFLMHRLLRRCGVSLWHATLATLTLTVSPLFFPLAFSFMSDVPGLLAILCCFYSVVRALQAKRARAALLWIGAASLSNVMLGSVRQIAWMGVLVVVPCVAWVLRRYGRDFLLATAGIWVGCAAAIALTMRWFARQPFILREPLLAISPDLRTLSHLLIPMLSALARVGLTLILYSLPVTLAVAGRLRLRDRRVQVAFAVGSLLLLVAMAWVTLRHLPNSWLAPFTYDSLGVPGFQDFVMLPGLRPAALSNGLRALLTIVTGLTALGMLLLAWRGLSPVNVTQHRAESDSAEYLPGGSEGPTSRELWALFGPYTLIYLALYVTRAFQWDRYLLPVAFLAVLLLLRWHQGSGLARMPGWSLAVVGLFAVFDVAATHDVFALYRARLAAAQMLQQAGVPRTQFSGGFDYDAWTELERTGYVKDPRLVPPPGLPGYRADVPQPRPCLNWFAPYTPSVDPAFSIAFTLPACMRTSQFTAVPYQSWLPWRQNTLKIGRIPRQYTSPAPR